MATIKFRWTVDELDNVRSLFNVQRVWRSVSVNGPWSELTSVGHYVSLVANQVAYYFDDTMGAAGLYYAVSYYNTASSLESELSDPVRVDSSGYISIADIRDEGFTVAQVTDAQVARGIMLATQTIDRITRQWFEPRARTFVFDATNVQDHPISVPIITVTSVYHDEDVVDPGELLIYNRHLTQGLIVPDDRQNPRISWRDDYDHRGLTINELQMRWRAGRRRVKVAGIFGYTELGPYDTPGETSEGSQVPLSYGQTPELIKLACRLLTIRLMMPRGSSAANDAINAARLTSVSTRDQSYSMAAPSQADLAFGMSGSVEVDTILTQFTGPLDVGVV